MNECFTDPIFGNFCVERKRAVKEGVRKRKDFPENLILNKYLELLEVQKETRRRRHSRGRWSLGGGEEKWRGSMRGWR